MYQSLHGEELDEWWAVKLAEAQPFSHFSSNRTLLAGIMIPLL